MKKGFPLEFTLEDGIHVMVKKVDTKTYDFVLKKPNAENDHFTYVNDESWTQEKEDSLNFDELNALRAFWLMIEREEIE